MWGQYSLTEPGTPSSNYARPRWPPCHAARQRLRAMSQFLNLSPKLRTHVHGTRLGRNVAAHAPKAAAAGSWSHLPLDPVYKQHDDQRGAQQHRADHGCPKEVVLLKALEDEDRGNEVLRAMGPAAWVSAHACAQLPAGRCTPGRAWGTGQLTAGRAAHAACLECKVGGHNHDGAKLPKGAREREGSAREQRGQQRREQHLRAAGQGARRVGGHVVAWRVVHATRTAQAAVAGCARSVRTSVNVLQGDAPSVHAASSSSTCISCACTPSKPRDLRRSAHSAKARPSWPTQGRQHSSRAMLSAVGPQAAGQPKPAPV